MLKIIFYLGRWNPGYECSIAAYNPKLIPTTPTSNASTVSLSATCVAFFKLRCNYYANWNLPTTTCHAIQVTDIARTHLSRIRTWGNRLLACWRPITADVATVL